MGKHLVFVGGGHAHLTALVRLKEYIRRGHKVTLISPSPHQYYSGMAPGMISGIYRPQEVRFHVRRLAEDRGAEFLGDSVTAFHPRERVLFLKSGKEIPYDIVSFNTGSEVPAEKFPGERAENIFPVKPVIHFLSGRRFILRAPPKTLKRFLVAGGGPAGVEVTANLNRLLEEKGDGGNITLIGGTKLLSGYPEKVRNLALKFFQEHRIEVLEGAHAKEFTKNGAILQDGRSLEFDAAFLAVGIRPSPIFKESGVPVGEGGELLVDSFLRSPAYPEIFGGGDCIALKGARLAKVGVYAVRQNPILFHNLMAALEGGSLRPFVPQKNYLAILNMGFGRGILWRKGFVWEGRLAFLLKDYLDRSFMKKFQVSGELKEEE
ncbi:MAG: pyridine nucleotide-disulfide oxidoreductase [Deltaproteobacteria bacterium]|nr:MAG: pyridine nucleotide-disulfide oxidoreductase [Deltaproteobacteria bacterium]